MSVSASDFWKLLVESRLLSPAQCQRLHAEYSQVKGASDVNGASTLAEWLVAKRAVSRYQAKILLAGRPGPFAYGDYRVYDRITSGRLAGLFKAVHPKTQHPVLLHFLAGPAAQQAALWSTVVRQVEAAAELRHPNLSRTYELVDLDTFKFVVVEHLSGNSAEEALAPGKPLPAAQACRIARQAALGLARLHQTGEAHGDVRPANVWLDANGSARLLLVPLSRDPALPGDLSGSDLIDGGTRSTAATPYLAPELSLPGRTVDASSDIYALGATLFQLLTGAAPSPGADIASALQRIGAPDQLGQVVSYMMAPDPASRYRQATDVAQALAYFAGEESPAPAAMKTQPAFDAWLDEKRHTPVAPVGPVIVAGAGPAIGAAFPAIATENSAAPAGIAAITAPTTSPRERLARKKSNKTPLMVGGAAAGVAALIAVVVVLSTRSPETPSQEVTQRTTDDPAASPEANGGTTAPVRNVAYTPIADDGTTLWGSPTAGQPVDLHYLPAGSQVFFIFRPADIVAHPQGEELLAALGPLAAEGRAYLEKTSGLAMSEIERATIAIHTLESGEPASTIALRLKEATPAESLASRWQGVSPVKKDAATLYRGGAMSYYLPAREGAQYVVMSDMATLEQIAESELPLQNRREMEALFRESDAARMFSLYFTPNFLFGDARHLLSGDFAKLKAPIQWFLGDGVQAAMLSLHVDDNTFVEFRAIGTADESSYERSRDLATRVGEIPDRVENYLFELNPHPYAKRFLLGDFRDMLKFVPKFARSGVEGDQAIVNCYLPGPAAESLLIGAELSVAHSPGQTIAAAGPQSTAPKPPASIAERLKQPITLSFDRDTLEKSMVYLSEEIGTPVEIIGGDLELDGITKNQSFGLDERNKPAGDILRKILLQANPEGKLVYVVKPGESGEDTIFITTRAAVAKRGDKLPSEFEQASN